MYSKISRRASALVAKRRWVAISPWITTASLFRSASSMQGAGAEQPQVRQQHRRDRGPGAAGLPRRTRCGGEVGGTTHSPFVPTEQQNGGATTRGSSLRCDQRLIDHLTLEFLVSQQLRPVRSVLPVRTTRGGTTSEVDCVTWQRACENGGRGWSFSCNGISHRRTACRRGRFRAGTLGSRSRRG